MTAAGGLLTHTPDDYPVCDWVRPGVYAIVDSGHGFKTLAIGRLVAEDLDGGEPLLEPFRLGRFAAGATHVASQGPIPLDRRLAAMAMTQRGRQGAREAHRARLGAARRDRQGPADHGHLRVRREARARLRRALAAASSCGRSWDTGRIPAEQYDEIRRLSLRYRALPVAFGARGRRCSRSSSR